MNLFIIIFLLFTFSESKSQCNRNSKALKKNKKLMKKHSKPDGLVKKRFQHSLLKSYSPNKELLLEADNMTVLEQLVPNKFIDSVANIKEDDGRNDELDPETVETISKKYNLPQVIEKCSNLGDIALTFDDGISEYTPKILEILEKENIQATFFILGNTLDVPKNQAMVNDTLDKMIRNGHTIASHSYSHPNFDDLWPEVIQHEMNRAKGLFLEKLRRSPRFMRPPFGNINARSIKALNDLGYFIIKWNLDTNDWMYTEAPEKSFIEFRKKLPDQSKIIDIKYQKMGLTELGVKTMINALLDSKIVLMHDINPGIIPALPRLIKHAKELGYRFVNMEECLGGLKAYIR